MKITKEHTFFALLTMTVFSGLLATKTKTETTVLLWLLLLWAGKFLLVAFDFMEVKKANIFWKVSLGFVLLIILTTILLLF